MPATRVPCSADVLLLLAAFLLGGAGLGAQTPPSAAGHWEGAILVPGAELGVNVDLALDDEGKWTGDISIPAQATEDFPLSGIVVAGEAVSFRMGGVPGEPTFQGTLSEDGTTITGRFTQGGATLEFRLKRVVKAGPPGGKAL